MTNLDAKDILDLVREKWDIVTPKEGYTLPNGNFDTGILTPWTGTGIIDSIIFYSGLCSVDLSDTKYIQQVLSRDILKTNITTFGFYAKGNSSIKITLTFSDTTTSYGTFYGYEDWHYYDILTLVKNVCTGALLFTDGKSVSTIKIESTEMNTCNVDDVVLLVEGDLYLALDEYNPNNPLYQIVFINRPERTVFVAPNVIKHEQDIHIEMHVKLIRYEPSNVDSKRTIFKAMKGELSRIFNTFRFDNVGSTINLSAWVDNKLPHGVGLDKEPLELVTRLTLQIFYYESTDGSNIGVRVSEVEILDADLLGLIDAHWIDTNPWVHLQVPKGPLLEQHLLGPHIDGEITTHDYASLHLRLYETPIVLLGIQYPILVDGTKIKFSTDIPNNPQFTIKMIDDEGNEYTYDFYDVRIKQVELMKTNTSGQNEAIWKIFFMAEYCYYTAPS